MKRFSLDILFENKYLSQVMLKNTIWMAGSFLIAKLSKFFMMIVIARTLTPEIFGQINYIIVLSAFCFCLSEIGLSLLINREYQQEKIEPQQLFSAGLAIKIFLVGSNFIIALVAMNYISNSLKLPFLVFIVMNAIDSLKMYYIAIIRAQNNRQYEAIAFMIETLVTSILGIVLIWQTGSILFLSLAYLSGSLLSSCYILFKSKNIINSLRTAKAEHIKYILKKLLPFTLAAFLAIAITSIDTLMIQWIDGNEGVGYFQAGLKISETILIIPILFMTNLFPFTAKYNDDDKRQIDIVSQSTSIMIMVGLPIIIGGIFLSEEIITAIYSISYIPAIKPFKILLIATFPMFFLSLFNGLLLAINKEKVSVTLTSISFIINIILNIILIPKMGVFGAVIGTMVSRIILLMMVYLFLVKKYKNKIFQLRPLLKYSFYTFIMIKVIELSKGFINNIFILICFGAILYLVILLITRDQYIKKAGQILRSI